MAMTILRSSVLLVCLWSACPPQVVRGQDAAAETILDKENAATHYKRAGALIENLPSKESIAIRKAIDSGEPADCDAILAKHGKRFERIYRMVSVGSKCELCDWGSDYSDGPHTLLVNAGRARVMTQAGCLLIRKSIALEDYDRAIDIWTSMMTLARHMSYDPCVVCVLNGMQSERAGIDIAMQMMLPRLNGKQLTRLHASWEKLPKRLTIHAALLKGQAAMIAWAKQRPIDLHRSLPMGENGVTVPDSVEQRPPSQWEVIRVGIYVKSIDWERIETLAVERAAIAKLPADKAREQSDLYELQIRSLPERSTREVAELLILPGPAEARDRECDINKRGRLLSERIEDRENDSRTEAQ